MLNYLNQMIVQLLLNQEHTNWIVKSKLFLHSKFINFIFNARLHQFLLIEKR